MDYRPTAHELIAELFADRGASILDEARGPQSWEEVLSPLPDAVFHIKSDMPGLTLLTLARDLWGKQNQILLATAATRGLLRWHVDAHGQGHPDTLMELGALGALAQRAGHLESGGKMLEDAWTGLRSVVGGRDLRLAIVAGNLGVYYVRVGRLEDAAHVLDQAYRIRQRERPDTIGLIAAQLGEVRLRLGQVDEGLPMLREAWVHAMDTGGANHPRTVQRAKTLAIALNRLKKYRESVPIWRDLHALAASTGNAERTAEMGFHLGVALSGSHHKEEGQRLIEDALRWTRETSDRSGEPHPTLPDRLTTVANMHISRRRPYEAEDLLREAVDAEVRLSGDDSPEVARRYATLANLCVKLGRPDEALGYLDPASSLLRSTLGDNHPRTQAVVASTVGLLLDQVEALVERQDRATAQDLLSHAKGLGGQVLGFEHALLVRARRIAEAHRLKV